LQYSCFYFLRPRFCIFVLFWPFLFDADRLDGAILGCNFLFFVLCIDGAHTLLLCFGYRFICHQTQKRTARCLISGTVFPFGNHRSGAYFDVYSYVLKIQFTGYAKRHPRGCLLFLKYANIAYFYCLYVLFLHILKNRICKNCIKLLQNGEIGDIIRMR